MSSRVIPANKPWHWPAPPKPQESGSVRTALLPCRAHRPWCRRLLLVLLLLPWTLNLRAAYAGPPVEVNSTWDLGATGSWNVDTNWSPVGVPNNDVGTVYNVLVDGAAGDVLVAVDFVDPTINTLTIDSGDTVRIDNGRLLHVVSAIANGGTILFNAGNSNTRMRIEDHLMLTGGGAVIMSDHPHDGNLYNYIEAGTAGWRLTNVDNVISGAGYLGAGNMSLTNQGTIQGDNTNPNMPLVLKPWAGGDFTNEGLMQAAGTGRLHLEAGDYINTPTGMIKAQTGSYVLLNNGIASITGGEFVTEGTGAVIVEGAGGAVLVDVTNNGDFLVANGRTLECAGTLTNNGSLSLLSTGSFTRLQISGDLLLTGTDGNIIMSGSDPLVETLLNGSRLTNASNTISGSGHLGNNNMSLTNQHIIEATDPTISLALNPINTGDFTNEAEIRATGGGIISLGDGAFINTETGVIRAQDASQVLFNNGTATVTGGQLVTEGSGFINVQDGALAQLVNLTLNADFRVSNGHEVLVDGTLQNEGSITLNSGASLTSLRTAGDNVTLTGSGSIIMSGEQARIYIQAAGQRLTNNGNTIRGSGFVCDNGLSLTNAGTIIGDGATALIMDPPNSQNTDITNTGTIQATSPSGIYFYHGTFINTGGVIEALDGSQVALGLDGGQAVITGGELTTAGSGVIRIGGGAPRLIDLQTSGLLRIDNGIDPIIEGTIENTGTIQFNSSSGNYTILYCNGDVFLTGGGTVSMANNIDTDHWNNLATQQNGSRLTNVDNHITGSGRFGNNSLSITNQGTIEATESSVSILFDQSGGNDFTNEGLLRASGDAGINILSSTFNQTGTVIIAANSRLDRTGDYIQTAGTTTVNGELQATGSISLQGGVLKGDGLVDGPTTNAAEVSPGLLLGTLSIEGDFIQDPLGTLTIELAGSLPGEYDLLTVTGDVQLAGTLNVIFPGGIGPVVGRTLNIITATGTVSGTFDVADLQTYDLVYEPGPPGLVALTVPATDCNNNGIPDSEEIFDDCNANGIPDECESDCNANAVPDECDVDPADPDGNGQTSVDCDGDQVPDECVLPVSSGGLCTEDCDPDCDGNGIVDACDIADCPAATPACADCNLNGFPDACDVAPAGGSTDDNGDGIPDECVFAFASGSWTDPIWLGLPEGDYPDSEDSVPNAHVTIGGADLDVFLDETVVIDTLRLDDSATLRVTQTEVGDLMVVEAGGMLVEGHLQIANGRHIDASAGSVVIGLDGIYQAGAGTPDGSLVAGSLTVNEGPPGSAGQLLLEGSMGVESLNDFIINGVLADDKGDCTPPIIQVGADASLIIADDFIVSGDVLLSVDSTNPVILGGDFANGINGDQAGDFDWLEGALNMGGFVGGFLPPTQTIEAAGFDGGPWPFWLADNFVIGTLIVGPSVHVNVVDFIDNQQDGQAACDEALYVDTLIIEAGGLLTTGNCDVYYNTIINEGTTPSLNSHVRQILEPIAVDFDGNGLVNASDLATVLGAWGTCAEPCPPYCLGDADHNCQVDASDLAGVLGGWGPVQE